MIQFKLNQFRELKEARAHLLPYPPPSVQSQSASSVYIQYAQAHPSQQPQPVSTQPILTPSTEPLQIAPPAQPQQEQPQTQQTQPQLQIQQEYPVQAPCVPERGYIPFEQMEWIKRCTQSILRPAGCEVVPELSKTLTPEELDWLKAEETAPLIGELLLIYEQEIVRPTRLCADTVILNVQEVYILLFMKQYMTPKFVGKNVCPRCGRLLRLIRKESRLICPSGTCPPITYYYTNMTFASANFGATRINITHHYKRVPFFENYLLPYRQGSKHIDEEDLIKIWHLLTEQCQRTNRHEWKAKMITGILQQLKLSTKYKHCTNIISRRLLGHPIIEFSPEQFSEVIARVTILNEAFLTIHKELKRNNFPNFNYITNKICMQNGWIQLAEQFPLQRIPEKLKKQEEGWEKLIDYLSKNDHRFRWEFIPSN